MMSQPQQDQIPQEHEPLEVDDSVGSDSTFGDAESLVTSIASSVLAYRIENGRRYHAYKDGTFS